MYWNLLTWTPEDTNVIQTLSYTNVFLEITWKILGLCMDKSPECFIHVFDYGVMYLILGRPFVHFENTEVIL